MDIAPLSTSPTASRKRERENETPSQRHKREKAAERQRRKRERDRNNSNNGNTHITPTAPASNGVLFSIPPNEHQHEAPGYGQASRQGDDTLLSPEEFARRDKVRKAARERQRKHRALVKDRKMRELGLDMGNEISEVAYHGGHVQVNADPHHYNRPVMGHHELGHHPHGPGPAHVGEGQHPQGQVQGGEMFASTLLLSFSCAPLLKQHLLSTLSMSSEELTSFEPIIAEAWDRWDQQRRARYAQQAAPAGGPSSSPSYRHDIPESTSYPNGTPHTNASVSDFRSRFQRSIVAPSPFRTNTTFREASDTTGSNASNTSSSDKGGKKGGEPREADETVVGRLESVT